MRLSKIPVATSTAGRPEGLSVFAVSTDIFEAYRRAGVSACGRTRSRHKGGVRGVQGVRGVLGGSRFRARASTNPQYLLFGATRPKTVDKQAAPGSYTAFGN